MSDNKLWINKIIKNTVTSDSLLDRLISDGVIPQPRKDRVKLISSFLANFIRMITTGHDKLYHNADRNSYSYPVYFNGKKMNPTFGYETAKNCLRHLEDTGYITRHRGFYFDEHKCSYGFIEISEYFRSLILSLIQNRPSKDNSGKQYLIITDNKNKIKAFNRGEIMFGTKIVGRVKNYNEFLEQFDVTYNNGYKLNPWLCRIFKDNLKLHGRIYNLYGAVNYQTLPKEMRKTIKINGLETIELDYKHLHPSICYELLDIKYTGDIYDVNCSVESIFDIPDYVEDISNYHAMQRSLVKEVFIRMINSESLVECRQSIKKRLKDDQEKDEPMQEFIHIRKDYDAIAVLLMEELEKTHADLIGYFYTSYSMTLMNIDSEILMNILVMCEEKNIPALPIHDSVVVPSLYEEEVKKIMIDAYGLVLADTLNCHIEAK